MPFIFSHQSLPPVVALIFPVLNGMRSRMCGAMVLVSCQQVRFEDLSYSLMVNEKKSLPYRFDSEFEPVVNGSLINQTAELEIHQNAMFC